MAQLPQEPPQPSSPQSLPVQFAVQATHCAPSHFVPGAQLPQEPPQPSSPHCLPAHAGWQQLTPVVALQPCAQGMKSMLVNTHWPSLHWRSDERSMPSPLGLHRKVNADASQVPQEPPQPSSPHWRPLQSGVQRGAVV
jgi:hypothetical protein